MTSFDGVIILAQEPNSQTRQSPGRASNLISDATTEGIYPNTPHDETNIGEKITRKKVMVNKSRGNKSKDKRSWEKIKIPLC